MRWLLCAAAVIWSTPTAAQNRYKRLCEDRERKLCAQAVVKGELVPFDGQLYTAEKAIQQSQRARYCDARVDIEVRHAREASEVQVNLEKQLRQIDQETYKREVEFLMKRLEAAYDRPWIQHPAVVATVTGLLVVGAIYGGAQLAQAAK